MVLGSRHRFPMTYFWNDKGTYRIQADDRTCGRESIHRTVDILARANFIDKCRALSPRRPEDGPRGWTLRDQNEGTDHPTVVPEGVLTDYETETLRMWLAYALRDYDIQGGGDANASNPDSALMPIRSAITENDDVIRGGPTSFAFDELPPSPRGSPGFRRQAERTGI